MTTYSGTCGDNAIWTFYSDTGNFVISGTGVASSNAGYTEYIPLITSAIVEEGITSLTGGIFDGFVALIKVVLAASIEFIGDGSFYGCRNLKDMTFLGECPRIDANHGWISGGQTVRLHTKLGWKSTMLPWGYVTFIDDYTINSDVSVHNNLIVWEMTATNGLRFSDPNLANKALATDAEGNIIAGESSTNLNITPISLYEVD